MTRVFIYGAIGIGFATLETIFAAIGISLGISFPLALTRLPAFLGLGALLNWLRSIEH